MAEYIEREAAIKEIMNDAHEQVSYCREDAADCIRYMDAADVTPVRHGQWVCGETLGREWMKCDQCLKSQTPNGVFTYCPNCGAKMDGGEPDA